MIGLPDCRRPFEAPDFREALQYLQERVEAGDFNPRSWPTISAGWVDIGQVDPEAPAADMLRQHECLTNEEDLGVFG